jgi:uncharacterized membrane protein
VIVDFPLGNPIFNVQPSVNSMKKFLVVLSLTALAFACTPKAVPTSSTQTSDDTIIVTKDTVTTIFTANADIIQAGQTIYTTKCVKCHAQKNTADFTKVQWDGILKEMAPKAKLNETETAQVAAYVKANAKDAQP